MTLALRTRGTSLAARGGSEGEGRERTGVWGAWWEEGGGLVQIPQTYVAEFMPSTRTLIGKIRRRR